jgi:putative phosphoribosyl transferase
VHFRDRKEAGQKLAEALLNFEGRDAVIYALPRGGVVLGYEIAKALKAPLDIVITRKVGHPNNPEYAVCAVTEGGVLICNDNEKRRLDPKWLESRVKEGVKEAKRRRDTYLKNLTPINPVGKTVIIVDDGVATGLTMRAAIRDIREKNPKAVVVAIPVVPRDTARVIGREADESVALDIPRMYLGAVGAYYDKFPQVSDEEVIELLEKSRKGAY